MTEEKRKHVPNANGLYTVVRYTFPDGAVEFTYHEGCTGSPEEWAAGHMAAAARSASAEGRETRCTVYESIMPVDRNHILERLRKTQEVRPSDEKA